MTDAAKPHYLGHRRRLREKFLEKGSEALLDYEIVELVLMLLIPQRDVKPVAKALLARFKGISGIFAAEIDVLTEVSGVGRSVAAGIKPMHAAFVAALKSRAYDAPALNNWSSVVDYCIHAYGQAPVEQVVVLYLDAAGKLLRDAVMQTGTTDSSVVYPREIVRCATVFGASSVILCHNHPAGSLEPSPEDIKLTFALANALKSVDVILIDHVIITRSDYTTLKARGMSW